MIKFGEYLGRIKFGFINIIALFRDSVPLIADLVHNL